MSNNKTNLVAGQQVDARIDLKQTWSRDDVSTERVLTLLIKNDYTFKGELNGNVISEFTATLLSEGRAFVSKVFKIDISLNNNEKHSWILKVPHTRTWKNYASRRLDEFPENRYTDEEMDQVAIDFHNTECEFYKRFDFNEYFTNPPDPQSCMRGMKHPCPIPKIFYMEKITDDSEGLIIMENLADNTHPLGFYASGTKEQLFEVARSSAFIQWFADNPELKEWWSGIMGKMYLDLFVDEFMLTGLVLAKQFPELIEMLEDIKPTFTREFCYASVVDKPKEYGATSFVHGDMQPNNILFKVDSNGQVGSEIAAIIDWQLIFAGNPLVDLTKFMICSLDWEVRKDIEQEVFDVYYNTLKNYYGEEKREVPFSYEQAYELYNLSIGQQTSAMVILMLFVEKNKDKLGLDENRAKLFSQRILDSVKHCADLVKKYGWNEKFGQDVDFKKYM